MADLVIRGMEMPKMCGKEAGRMGELDARLHEMGWSYTQEVYEG